MQKRKLKAMQLIKEADFKCAGLLILIFVVIISCENKKGKDFTKEEKIKIVLNFPDTVIVNNSYSGTIYYQNALDSITTILYDEQRKKFRYIQYEYTGTKTLNYSFEHLRKIVKDTAYADDNHTIPINNIWFENVGTFYFDGIITDEILLDEGKKDKNGEPIIRIITDEFRLSKKVVVVDEKHQTKKSEKVKVI